MDSLGKLRKEFEHWKHSAYYYQKHNYYESERKASIRMLVDSFFSNCSIIEKALSESLWVMELTPVEDAVPYSFKDLKDISLNFSHCLMGTTHGRLFAGHESNFSIKTWDFLVPQIPCYADHPSRFCNELEILTSGDRHPCLMKLKGFCFQYILAVVYDEMPTEILSYTLCSGNKFGWNARMKVATQLASLFTWFHERRYAFGSVRPRDIMIDKNFNIKVFDFGFLTPVREEDNGVTLPDAPEASFGIRTLKADVYVFGVLLVELIGNDYDGIEKKMALRHWILKQLREKRSIVDKSILQDNDELANGITDLAVKCLSEDPNARPDMKEVSANLSNLVGATPN